MKHGKEWGVRYLARILVGIPIVICLASDAVSAGEDFASRVQPLVEGFCVKCHSGEDPAAGVSLSGDFSPANVLKGYRTWTKVLEQLKTQQMPPDDAEQPVGEMRAMAVAWIDDVINNIDCSGEFEAGRVTLRRLNRHEYQRTVFDLLGVHYEPAADFPGDDVGYGFDRIGDVLSLPPLLMEKYLDAAESIAERAIMVSPRDSLVGARIAGADMKAANGRARGNGTRILSSNGEMWTDVQIPKLGRFELQFSAFGQQAGDEVVKVRVDVDEQEVRVVEIPAVEQEPGTYIVPVTLEPGAHKVGLAFINDFYQPDAEDPGQRDRNLGVVHLELHGPFLTQEQLPKSHHQILLATPSDDVPIEETAELVLKQLMQRAFRRPVEPAELQRLVMLVLSRMEEGESFAGAVQLALKVILVSPHFLFKVELRPGMEEDFAARPLNDFELATRLSYFLWNSMPDEELMAAASEGQLGNEETLLLQVKRLLDSPQVESFVHDFSDQWLQLRLLEDVSPDPDRFANFDESLRVAMQTETRMFVAAIIKEDQSIVRLLDADFTFLNNRLAEHYGLAVEVGDEFQRISLVGTERGGLLSQGSILTVTSNPTRTSPVKRGKWVMENLFGEVPPAPPPGVDDLDEEVAKHAASLRERLKSHRSDARCAACHDHLDPLGFALENFDAVGVWRTTDGELPIDASGELKNGVKFSGFGEFRRLLVENKQEVFCAALAEKLLVYAIGRGLSYYDRCAIDKIVAAAKADDYRMSTILREVVRSVPFKNRGEIARLE